MMTVEAIEYQVDNLREAAREIEAKQQALCVDCPAILVNQVAGGRLIVTCPVSFAVGAVGCWRAEEHEELEDAKMAVLRDIGKLNSLDAEIWESEVA